MTAPTRRASRELATGQIRFGNARPVARESSSAVDIRRCQTGRKRSQGPRPPPMNADRAAAHCGQPDCRPLHPATNAIIGADHGSRPAYRSKRDEIDVNSPMTRWRAGADEITRGTA